MQHPAIAVAMLLTTATLSARRYSASAYSFVARRSLPTAVAAGRRGGHHRGYAAASRPGGIGAGRRAGIVMWGEEDAPRRPKGESDPSRSPVRRSSFLH